MAADGQLLFNTKLDPTGFNNGMAALKTAAKTGFSKVGQVAGKAATAVKTSMAIGAIAVAGLGIAAIKVGAEFEAQMSRVQAISGATGDELDKLTAQAKQLGADTAFSAAEAAAGMENLASAGFSASEIMKAMPGLLDMAAVSGGDVGLAAEVAASSIRAFGLEATDAGHVADVFAKAASSTNAEVGDMGEAMKYVAPVAKAMGQEIEMTAAAIGIMSDAGIKGGQAGTALRGAFSRLAKPTKAMKEKMDDLSLSFYDAQGNMLPMTGIIAELEKGTNGLTQEQKNNALITLFGQESLSGMLALVDAGPDKLAKLTGELEKSDGAAKAMAETILNNTKGSIDELMGSVETLGISIYGSTAGPLKTLAETATGYVNDLSKAFQGTADNAVTQSQRIKDGVISVNDGFIAGEGGAQNFATVLGGIFGDMAVKAGEALPAIITAASEIVSTFLTTLSENSEKFATAGVAIMTTLITAIAEYSSQFLILGLEIITQMAVGLSENAGALVETITGALSNLITAIIDNLPLLMESGIDILEAILNGIVSIMPQLATAAIELLVTFLQGIALALPLVAESGTEIINSIITAIIENIDLIITAATNILTALVTAIVDNLPIIIPAVISLINKLITVLIENLPLLLDMGIQILTAVVQGIVDNLPALIPGILAMITAVCDALINNIALIIELGIVLIMAIIDGLIQALPFIIAEVPRIINAFSDAIYAALPKILAMGLQIIVELGKGIINNIPLIIENAGAIFKALLNVFTLSNLFSLGKSLISKLGEGVQNFGPNLMSTINNLFNNLINIIVNIFKGGLNVGKSLISNLISGISNLIPNIMSLISNLATNGISAITTGFSSAMNVGKTFITNIGSGISSMVGTLLASVRGIAANVMTSITSGLGAAADIGKNLIYGIWNGIGNVTGWITDKIKGFAGGVMDSIKGFFGIKSPSKKMEHQVGAMLPPGIGKGVKKATPKLLSNVKKQLNRIKDTFKEGLTMDSTIGAQAETTVRHINEYDYVMSGDGKKLAMANEINVYSMLDGREVGRGTAGYVSEEQALSLKRRG